MQLRSGLALRRLPAQAALRSLTMDVRPSSLLCIAAAAGAIGVAAGAWSARRARPAQSPHTRAADAGAGLRAPTAPLVDEAVLRLELRRALHEELQRVAPPKMEAVPEAPSQKIVSPAQVRAFTEASALIDHAKAGAGWNRDDAQTFRRLMPQLGP